MDEHILIPSRNTLHGILCSQIPPAMKIRPGDIVKITTLEPDWRVERPPISRLDAGEFYPRILGHDDGHALCGPIAIEGAKPGITLAVDILSVVPGDWGWSCVGISDQDHLDGLGFAGENEFWLWDIDLKMGVCTSIHGHAIPMASFPGVLAVAPQGEGNMTTKIPGPHGGNLDCRSLVAGSRIYLPVFHEGALFSAGDGHAAQGDGESGGTAIECPLKELKLRFSLIDAPLWGPVCETPEGIVTFGFDSDLNKAAYKALKNMRRYLIDHYALKEKEAMMLCSICVDLRITQIVNGVRSVHALFANSRAFLKR